MFAHIKIVNEFSTPFVRTTKLGYCLSTLEVALNHILNLSSDDLVQEEEEDDEAGRFNERRRSMTKSFKMSVYNSVRT